MVSNFAGHLPEFNIDGQVVEYHPGPVVTRYEIDLAAGTKVSKITGLAKTSRETYQLLQFEFEVFQARAPLKLKYQMTNVISSLIVRY